MMLMYMYFQVPHKKKHPQEMDDVMAAYRKKYPNIPDVLVANGDPVGKRQDPNLEFADEAEAYHKFKSHGYFTAHPAAGRNQCSVLENVNSSI